MKRFKKMSYIVSVALIFTVISQSSVPMLKAQTTFSDISESRYPDSIQYVADKKAVGGYPDGTFRPKQTMNRAELATILVAPKVPFDEYKDKKNCFVDVQEQWFAPYVCYAKELGLVGGYSDGTYRPAQNVNIAEAYLMTTKSFEFSVLPASEGEEWYMPYTQMVHNNTRLSNFAFLPDKAMTREEMALLMHEFFLLKERGGELSTVRNSRSFGCGVNPPSTVPTTSMINGVKRDYITVIPSGYNKETPMPIVFAFHGRTNSNAQVKAYYKVEEASRGKAIFVYPAGIKNGSSYTWSDPGDSGNSLRDFALFDQLLNEFEKSYCIDTDKVYVVGHSLGAWFTNSLACARGDVIRAIGSVAGGTTRLNCTGPVAAIILHNSKDNLVPISDGIAAKNQLIDQNQCTSDSVPVAPQELSCVSYQGCNRFAPVTWCEHHEDYAYWDGSYYPHTWPKNAGKEIWNFLENAPG